MRSIILKLTLATLALGLWAARPATVHAQMRQPMMVQGNRFGMRSNVNIFSMPQFSLMTDPRGANFGFSQQIVFGPSFRASFTPFSQFSIFRSSSSSSLVFTPAMGPVLRMNTPAITAFSFSPVNGLRQINIPSVSILSNLNGTISTLNPNMPTFLAGNFNFTIPFNGTFSLAVPSSSLSANGATTGMGMSNQMMTSNQMMMCNSMMNSAAMNTGMTRCQTAAMMAGANLAPTTFFPIAQGLAMGLTLDQVVQSPLATLSGSASVTGSRTASTTRSPSRSAPGRASQASAPPLAAVQAAAAYNGYVPPTLVMQ